MFPGKAGEHEGSPCHPVSLFPAARLQGNDISTNDRIDVVGPLVHHGATLNPVFCAVVGSTYRILLFVRELAFYHIGTEPHFVERGGCHRSEAMNSGATMVAHPVHRIEHRIVAHAFFE